MAFEDLYRLLDVRDGPRASLEDIYVRIHWGVFKVHLETDFCQKQYYALKHLYQTSNRQDIPEVCRAMKDAVAILTDPGFVHMPILCNKIVVINWLLVE